MPTKKDQISLRPCIVQAIIILFVFGTLVLCSDGARAQNDDTAQEALRALDAAMETGAMPEPPQPAASPRPSPQSGRRAVVKDDDNNLRESGGDGYKQAGILAKLNQGDVVYEQEQRGKWSRVATQDGLTGWVHSACLRLEAEDLPGHQVCPGDLPRQFTLDSAGKGPATVALVERPTENGGVASLIVRNASGDVLWRGPEAKGPLAFFCRDEGIYWPGAVGDIEGDGHVALLVREPQSDVSPSSFFQARWDGHGFTPISHGWSLLESPPGSGRFIKAAYTYDGKPVTWIMDAKGLEKNGELRVTVYADSGGGVRTGTALFRLRGNGGAIVRWLSPLK